MDAWLMPRPALGALVSALRSRGYDVVGPTLRDGAIVIDSITSDAELPAGLGDTQEPGRYRVAARLDAAVFGYAVGVSSFKKYCLLPEERLFRVHREGKSLRFAQEPMVTRKLALLGARGCDLAALRLQDRVLGNDRHRDERYAARRAEVIVVAVHCGSPSASCFCTSMGTGPRAAAPWDLALTELIDGGPHRFIVETGSAIGVTLVQELALVSASHADRALAAKIPVAAGERITRHLETAGLRERLAANAEHPRYSDLGTRCLGCANCTLVCPTCFCTTIDDFTELDGSSAERRRRWDSCFTLDFSYLHGGSVRPSVGARYRQWLLHKLSTWHDQFGTSGCVGCGRCITWCPVGIDITEEAAAVSRPSKAVGTPEGAPWK
ncbi:MAG: 4Fe-4S dicluster domain-containing protein [Myxococcales bacterium]|nr:4Fe-4S dicluster domain-containing protein [Myxococcales bacterium]